jgi:alcohol dehydrogenase
MGVGGGSSLDAAKMIAALGAHPKNNVKQLAGILKFKSRSLPLYLIPTTSGTGSEVTAAAVITCSKQGEKMLIVDPKMMAISTAIDPLLMQGMPAKITAETGIDALTHAIEAFTSGHSSKATNRYAITAIKLIFTHLNTAYQQGDNNIAREAVALASTYAGLAFSRANVGYVHAIAHQLGNEYHVPHGLANAMVLPHILDFNETAVQQRFAFLARELSLTVSQSEEQQSKDFIWAVRQLLIQLNIPAKLGVLKQEDVKHLAKKALCEAHYLYAVPKYMNIKTCQKIITKLSS